MRGVSPVRMPNTGTEESHSPDLSFHDAFWWVLFEMGALESLLKLYGTGCAEKLSGRYWALTRLCPLPCMANEILTGCWNQFYFFQLVERDSLLLCIFASAIIVYLLKEHSQFTPRLTMEHTMLLHLL